MKKVQFLLAILAALLSTVLAESAPEPSWLKADPASVARWQAMRFGMFIHWGPVSVTGKEISWSLGGAHRDRPDISPTKPGTIPPEEYNNLYKTFDPVRFNADQWVKIAKDGGMKYIVLVAKHLDGFCMFDSQLTDYKITNTPFRRDVCAELAEACHKAGISFGVYYCPPDWHHPDFCTDHHDRYIEYMHEQVRELLTNYGKVDELWFDIDNGINTPETWDNAALFPMIRQLQPQIIITKRCGGWGDIDTPEQRVGGFNNTTPWESCMTISAHNQWAWGGDKDGVKPPEEIVRMLVSCSGGDGNMLLNVGPQPDGEINAEQVGCLKEVGAWLEKYGESIYGTRGGPYLPGRYGVSTRKGNAVYIHLLKFAGETITFPKPPKKVVSASLLTGGKVQMTEAEDGLNFAVAKADQQPIDTIIKLELDGSAEEITPISLAEKGLIKPEMKATASNIYSADYGADKAVDGDENTRWATSDGTKQAWLEVDLGEPKEIGRAFIREGWDRTQRFELQYYADGEWKPFYSGGKIGSDLDITFPPVTAQRVRLNILNATDGPTIWEFQLLPPEKNSGKSTINK